MVKNICRDMFFLRMKSEPADRSDRQVGIDLSDTLAANADRCVGMAANMIGVRKRIIIVNTGVKNLVMFNPVILKKDGEYTAEEGCLSLSGTRSATRYRHIEVEYSDSSGKKHRMKYSGETAQIIQHEIDHCDGVLI